MTPEEARSRRDRMVHDQLAPRGIVEPRVLAAMLEVPRHLFLPPAAEEEAYADHPVAIGEGQTISQPYVVAAALQALSVTPGDRVLEVGAGCGYQAAVAAAMGARVIALEIHRSLVREARENLARTGYERVEVHHADGWKGWPKAAPYHAIMLSAAAPVFPETLWEQLSDGGRLVAPMGTMEQMLTLYEKRGKKRVEKRLFPVRYVPMTGGK